MGAPKMSYQEIKLKCAEALTGKNVTATPAEMTSTAKLISLISDSSIDSQSQIMNYQSLADFHLQNNVENLILPLNGKMKYEKKTYELNMAQFEELCSQLNSNLENKKYLIGEKITPADSTIAVSLKPAFENILGEAEREKYPNLTKWYETISAEPKLKKHLKVQYAKTRKVFDAAEVAAKVAKEDEGQKESGERRKICRK